MSPSALSLRCLFLLSAAVVLVVGISVAPPSAEGGDAPGDTRILTSSVSGARTSPQDTVSGRIVLRIDLTELEDNRISGSVRLPLKRESSVSDTIRWRTSGLDELEAVWIGPSRTREASILRAGSDTSLVVLDTAPTPSTSSGSGSDRDAVRPGRVDSLELRFAAPADRVIELRRESDGAVRAAWTRSHRVNGARWYPLPSAWSEPRPVTLRFEHPERLDLTTPGRRVEARPTDTGLRTVVRVERPILPHRLGWASRPAETVRRSTLLGEDRSVLIEYRTDPAEVGRAAPIIDELRTLLRTLEQTADRSYPHPHLRVTVVPGLHAPAPPIPGVVLVPDSLPGAPGLPPYDPVRYGLARILARQWTAELPRAEDLTPSWNAHLALEALTRAGDSLHAGAILRRAERSLRAADSASSNLSRIDPGVRAEARALWSARLLRGWRREPTGSGTSPVERAIPGALLRHVHALTAPDAPEIRVRYRRNAGADALSLETQLEQTPRAVAEDDAQPAPSIPQFEMSVEIGTPGGPRRRTVSVTAPDQTFQIPLSEPVDFVVVDPENEIPLASRVEQPAFALLDQIRRASTVEGRVRAARALERFDTDRALPIGIRGVLDGNVSLPVEVELVRTLGTLPPGGTRDALIRERLTAPKPRVRRAAVRAIGTTGEPGDAPRRTGLSPELVLERARTDSSLFVQAEAVRSAARLRASGWIDLVQSAFVTDAPNELIRRAAFDAARLGDVPASRGLQPALTWSRADRPALLRAAAAPYLARIGSTPAARDRLEALLTDVDERVRLSAAIALREIDASWADALRTEQMDRETHPRVRAVLRSGPEP